MYRIFSKAKLCLAFLMSKNRVWHSSFVLLWLALLRRYGSAQMRLALRKSLLSLGSRFPPVGISQDSLTLSLSFVCSIITPRVFPFSKSRSSTREWGTYGGYQQFRAKLIVLPIIAPACAFRLCNQRLLRSLRFRFTRNGGH